MNILLFVLLHTPETHARGKSVLNALPFHSTAVLAHSMNRSPRFQVLVAMSSRSPHRGGRSHRRGFSDRPHNGGRGPFVSGDLHFRSVRDANLGFRQGTFSNQTAFQPPPYNQNQQFRRPPPPYNQNQQFRQPPPYNQNQQFRPPPPYNPNQRFRQPPPPFDQNQAVRPRPSKPLDYRNWEYTKEAPSPNSERFVVLSYNILADYLAISHRSKLYFHIPRYMLDWEWRKKNILFELGLWSADIMCFQEVDRFQDLEEQLKLRGYSGIWKMRTGNAIDGCAIFWRASRFKLLYEEDIEFNKLGLRDNVAQICVLELMSRNCTDNTTALQSTSVCPNKVVICNIHVLFNPRRGEIKLGQVRTLLEKAHAVSKIWNYAPVVLCGDFNCTPKSPLYNFISEQKLDLSAVDRDKVSGQASAEIRAPPKPYPRVQVDGSIQVPSVVGSEEVGIKPSDPLSDNLKHNKDGNAEVFPSVNSSSQSHCTDTVLGVSDKAGRYMQCANKDSGVIDEVMKESQQTVVDGSKGETSATFFIPTDSLKDSSSCFQSDGRFPTYQGQINDEKHKFSPPGVSHSKDESEVTETTQGDKANTSSHLNNGSISDRYDLTEITENESTNCDDFTLSLDNDHPSNVECNPDFTGSSQFPSTELSSTPYPDEISSTSTSTDFVLADKLGNLSLGELDETRTEGESADKDDSTFVSTLHDMEDAFQSDFDQFETSNLDRTSNDLGDYVYDPSLWTPMEIATATGNEDQTFLEHPLQLRSTYAEAEDCSGTRDSNGEPMVTSYSRCFMGTVDYIWRSEGLQTVRVLAPIPKHAMQWTPGYPTKKWGSDHIALASEVAFVKTNR